MREQFFFGVPLRARATAQSWDRVCALLQMCLRSVINQTDGDFHILLACHDVPDFAEMSDPRVQILCIEAPVPTTPDEQMYDKGRKTRAIRVAMGQHGGGYLMLLDADDLVSNKLVSFVRCDQDPNGYLIDNGYEYDCSTGRVRFAPRFNRVCGSSAIFHFAPEDLPQTADDVDSTSDKFKGHNIWAATAADLGRPFCKLPFRGAMYLTNNGENHSALTGNIGWRRKLLRRLTPARRASDALRAEFALNANASCTAAVERSSYLDRRPE